MIIQQFTMINKKIPNDEITNCEINLLDLMKNPLLMQKPDDIFFFNFYLQLLRKSMKIKNWIYNLNFPN